MLRIHQHVIPIFAICAAQWSVPLLDALGQLTVDAHIGGGIVALMQQGDEMGFDRGADLVLV